ncbi:MAG: hypothetical protein WD069_11180 [Planctomycetales bacterium]
MPAAPFGFAESIASRRRREQGEVSDEGRSTFNFTVAEADGDQVPLQIQESERFLSRHQEALQQLRASDGVEDICLDFSWDFPRDGFAQHNTFPSSFLRQCAMLGIDIEISVYSAAEDGGD